jgi:hypothetical protein
VALPDFLLLGAPKAGTTALHVALANHPRLFLSAVKEPKFFLADGTPPPARGGPGDAKTYREYVWRRSDYEALFDPAPAGTLRGESTTLYLRDPRAHERIRALVPDARLVAVVRDPVDRAHSNWTHLRSAGLEPEPVFLRACALEPERAAAGWGPFWRYLELGFYGRQVEHLYSLFPREQVHVVLYRDLRQHPAETLDGICAFLGVEGGLVTEVPAQNVTAASASSALDDLVGRALRGLPERMQHAIGATAGRVLQRHQRTRPPLTEAEKALLVPYFATDIALLESLTGRRLAHWLDPANGSARRPLEVRGRFGTAHRSIDRPPADPTPLPGRQFRRSRQDPRRSRPFPRRS